MLRTAKQDSLKAAAVVGLSGLQSIAAHFSPTDKSSLMGLDEYLKEWIGVSAWAGLSGIFGQTAASKARITLAQMLGHYGHISELAGSVASGLYADRKLAGAQKWYGVYRRRGELPGIIGAIELARGDASSATRHFQEVLSRSGLTADDAALHLGYLGLSLASLGRRRVAIRAADAAFEQGAVSPTILTRIWRARAETLRKVGDALNAEIAIGEAIKTAREAALAGQLKKALKAQGKLKAERE
jgi:tetratricopeptide (TPR) repeat protein